MVIGYYTVGEHRLNPVLNVSAAVALINMQFIKKKLLFCEVFSSMSQHRMSSR